jgi:hypothetical protein
MASGFIVYITYCRLKVENAIFKVHRSFLVKSSTIIKDMLSLPQSGNLEQANDRNPLVLAGDMIAQPAGRSFWNRIMRGI